MLSVTDKLTNLTGLATHLGMLTMVIGVGDVLRLQVDDVRRFPVYGNRRYYAVGTVKVQPSTQVSAIPKIKARDTFLPYDDGWMTSRVSSMMQCQV